MGTHTPGPWMVCNGRDIFTQLGGSRADGGRADENDGWQVADCGAGVTFIDGVECTLPMKEQEANAKVMAAAPDLLAALRQCAIALAHAAESNQVYLPAYKAADAAIAKATQP